VLRRRIRSGGLCSRVQFSVGSVGEEGRPNRFDQHQRELQPELLAVKPASERLLDAFDAVAHGVGVNTEHAGSRGRAARATEVREAGPSELVAQRVEAGEALQLARDQRPDAAIVVR
jgi:hypothetical protein